MNPQEREQFAAKFKAASVSEQAIMLFQRRTALTLDVKGTTITAQFTEELNVPTPQPKKFSKRALGGTMTGNLMVIDLKDVASNLPIILAVAGFAIAGVGADAKEEEVSANAEADPTGVE